MILIQWWNQVLKSAGDKYIPLLIYKFDRKTIMCVIPAYLVSNALKHNQVTYMCPLEDICKDIKNILEKANVSG